MATGTSQDIIQPDPSHPGGYLNTQTGEHFAPGALTPLAPGGAPLVSTDATGTRHTLYVFAQGDPRYGKAMDSVTGQLGTGTSWWHDAIKAGLLTAGIAVGASALLGATGGSAAAGGAGATGGGAAGTSAEITAPGASGIAAGAAPAAPAVAGVAAAPSLGAQLLSAGQVAGKIVQGDAAGRAQEAQLGLSADQVALQRSQQENTQYRQAINDRVRGGLMQGLQDVTIGNLPPGVQMGTVTGGLRPSAVTGLASTGSDLQRQAILTMLKGAPTVPGATPMPTPSLWDQILAPAGQAAALYGAYKAPPPVKVGS